MKFKQRLLMLINVCLLIDIVRGQAYSVCSCDLLSEICDLNCCCDSDCLEFDKAAFRCQTEAISNTNKWCVPDTMLFFQNTPFVVKGFEDLKCIDIDNCKFFGNIINPNIP